MASQIEKLVQKHSFYMSKTELAKWGLLILVIMTALGVFIASLIIDNRRDSIVAEVKSRVEILAAGRAEVVKTWINGLKQIGNHIVEADIVRLFSTELGYLTENNSDIDIDKSMLAQLPYMQEVMVEFTKQNGLVEAIMVNRKGQPFLASSAQPKVDVIQQMAIENVLKTRQAQVLPIKKAGERLLLNILKPVFMLEEKSRNPQIVAVLISVFPIEESLAEIMDAGPLAQEGERLRLVQFIDKKTENIVFKPQNIAIQPISVKIPRANSFAQQHSPIDSTQVFMANAQVDGTPFTVLHEYVSTLALATLKDYISNVHMIVALVIIALTTLMIALVTFALGQRNRHRVQMQEKVLDALVKSVEIRDPYLSGHHNRLSRLTLQVANAMRLDVDERSTLYYSSLLSGIGKIFIPQEILIKKGKLTAKEMEILHSHVEHAMNVIGDMDFDYPVAEAIHQMYERMDGSGYPNKVSGTDINLLSRILGACDAYCAMIKPRAYRKEMTTEGAFKELQAHSDKFDKGVLATLQEVVDSQ